MSQNNNPISEPLQKGVAAANAVRGAVKTGKAIAAAAKGASAGGVWGAIGAFAWSQRKTLAKITIVIIAFMMIPVMIICMLPSLIFGGLTDSHSSSNPDTTILNDSTVVTDNLADITSKINPILTEALEAVKSNIDTDFLNTGADYKEITETYETTVDNNVNSFVAQYCASKNEDYKSVSVADMESIIRQNKDKLYSYSVTIEERSEDTNGYTETKKYAVYKITYNGADYFADEIFKLTDRQKALAKDYENNLNLFLK